MADHQKQQACEANTHNSQTIPLASVVQTNSNRPIRRYSKTTAKTNMYKPYKHPEWTIKKHSEWNPYKYTLHKNLKTNNRDDISQTKRNVNNRQRVNGNSVPFIRNIEETSQGSYAHIRTRYGRIVWKPIDWHIKSHYIYKHYKYSNIITFIFLFC